MSPFEIVAGKWIPGEKNSITGKAFVVPNTGNARLKVQFFWPFKGDYQIIALDENYQYALVGSKNRKYLWILSRSPEMEDGLYTDLKKHATEQGFDVGPIIRTGQVDRIIVLYGIPGPAFDTYAAFSNSCMDCNVQTYD